LTKQQKYTPYTYRITFIPTGQHYYGSKTARGCHPDTFWKDYFTSSKIVDDLIEIHGKDSFSYEIRKTFNSKRPTLRWEKKVLTKLNVANNNNWLNQKISVFDNFIEDPMWVNHPLLNKDKLIEKNKLECFLKLGYIIGRCNNYMTEEWHQNRSIQNTGENNPMFGKKRADLSARNKLPKRWVTNEAQDKNVILELVDEYLQNGWRLGRSQCKMITKEYHFTCEHCNTQFIRKSKFSGNGKERRFCSISCAAKETHKSREKITAEIYKEKGLKFKQKLIDDLNFKIKFEKSRLATRVNNGHVKVIWTPAGTFIGIKECAKQLEICTATVRKKIKQGEFKILNNAFSKI
jgi:hypothetical protein